MTKLISKPTKAALHTLAESFRKGNMVADLELVINRVEIAIEILSHNGKPHEDDEEWIDYLNEVKELCLIVLKRHNIKPKVQRFINCLLWDNYIDEETKAAYSLGSMYYNKMASIEDNVKDETVKNITNTLSIHIVDFFDELEKFANS